MIGTFGMYSEVLGQHRRAFRRHLCRLKLARCKRRQKAHDIEAGLNEAFRWGAPLVFACRRVLGGWIKANTNMPVRICPTHWREWNNKTGSSTYY
jgi:hypothetical protein